MKSVGFLCTAAFLSFFCSRGPTDPRPNPQSHAGIAADSRVATGGRHTRTVARPSTTITLPQGRWGGPQASLQVGPAGVTVELPCAHGTIDSPIVLDDSGRFDAPGAFVREGGPTRQDEGGIAARYMGRVDGSKMMLTIVISGQSAQTIGPFSLTRGTTAHLVKCL